MKSLYILVTIILGVYQIAAQDLTGKWLELWHDDGINAYAEMTIESQEGSTVKGYSFDVTKDAASQNFLGKYIESGRCSYTIEGEFDYDRQFLDITDVDMLFNEGHAPGRALLEYYEKDGKQYLEGRVVNRPGDDFVYGAGDLYVKVKYVKVPDDHKPEGPDSDHFSYGPPDYNDYLTLDEIDQLSNIFSWNWTQEQKARYEARGNVEKDPPIVYNRSKDNNYFSEEELNETINIADNSTTSDEIETTDSPDSKYFPPEESPDLVEVVDDLDTEQELIEEPVPAEEIEEVAVIDIPEPTEEEERVTEIDSSEDASLSELEEMIEPIVETEEEAIEDELAPNYEQEPITETEKIEIEEKYASRNTKTIANIRTQDKILKVVVKDYGEQDGDEISMIVDGKVLYRRLPITTLQKNLEIVLASDRKKNEIIFVAENLGRVPPNTARIELYLNGKKYSYSLLTDTSTNAKIVLLRE